MAENTYEEICTFCCEVQGHAESNLFYDLGLASRREEYILGENEHFVVMPCIGALTEWYVLIVSRRHVLSVGWLNGPERAALRSLLSSVRTWLEAVTGHQVMVFEHGSYDFRDKGGACYDHAHVHVAATTRTVDAFLETIPPSLTLHPCADWITEARGMVHMARCSYLALMGDRQELIGPATGAPSQFFRRCLASWLGAQDGEWDWLTYPRPDRVKAMMSNISHVGGHAPFGAESQARSR